MLVPNLVLFTPFLSLVCIEINSGEKVLPYIGFKLPFLFNLIIELCLKPKVVPALGERFNFLSKYKVNKIFK